MSAPILLGECTVCARRVYNRPDRPEASEWVRPAAKAALRPHRHPNYIGTCSLCSSRVFVGGDGIERVRVDGKPRPHQHKKPFEIVGEAGYRLIPVREEAPDTGEWRGWEIYASRMGAL